MTSPTRRRPSRRHPFAAGALAATLLLAACGSDSGNADDSDTSAASQEPTGTTGGSAAPAGTGAPAEMPDGGPAGTLVVALDREGGFLDPYHVQNHAGRSIAQAMFDTLVMEVDGEYVPALAESWDIVDDTTINFTLHPDVTFHNGEAFTASTVEYNLSRMLDPEVDSHYLPQFETVESIEVVDELNFVLHLAEPDANIIDTLTYWFMVPAEYAEEVGPGGFNEAPVGTGPFTFVSYAPDDRTVVTANPDYWEGSPKGVPMVETVEFRAIPELTTRVAELTAGEVDIAFKLAADQIETVESGGSAPVTYSDLSIEFIQINTASVGTIAESATGVDAIGFEALEDPDVRLALNLAIDREAIAEAMFLGYASPLGQPFAPGGALTPTIDLQYDYDPERAKELLADAGYGDGLTLQMVSNTSMSSDLLSLVASYFAEIGVTAEIELIEAATYNDGWVAGQFPHLRYATWSNPEQALELLIRSGDLISSYANPDADALVDEQAGQVVPEERKATIDELAQVMHDDGAWVFLWSTDAIVGVAPGVEGWEPRPSFVPVTNVTVTE